MWDDGQNIRYTIPSDSLSMENQIGAMMILLNTSRILFLRQSMTLCPFVEHQPLHEYN